MASWAELLSGAEPGEHVVQLYGDDDRLLCRNVGRYLAKGLRRGDGLIVIATPEHTSAIARQIVEECPGATFDAAHVAGRLVMLDAEQTLARLLLDGRPDATRFRSVVGEVIASVRGRAATGSVRAFGEMVTGRARRRHAARRAVERHPGRLLLQPVLRLPSRPPPPRRTRRVAPSDYRVP